MNKTITTILVVAVLLIGGILALNTSRESENSGTLFISVTDEAVDMETISEVSFEVDAVALRSSAEGQTWTEVSGGNESYNLLTLNETGQFKLYSQSNVAAGTYDEVRLTIGEVNVTTTDGTTSEAALPNDEMTFTGAVNISPDATSSVAFDVKADQSLHRTAEGEFVFAPVVEMTSQSNVAVNVDEENTVTTSGGTLEANVSVGMTVEGGSQANFVLDTSSGVEIEQGGTIRLLGTTQATSSANSTSSANAEANVNTETEADVEAGTDTEANATTSGQVELNL